MKTCLVVDDSRVIRKVARRILEDIGFEIAEASDGMEALAWCRAAMPDAILLDLVMPETDGWAVVAALGARADLQDVPVVLISGRDRYQEPLSASLLLANTPEGIPFGKLVACYRAVSEVLLPRAAERGRGPRENSPG